MRRRGGLRPWKAFSARSKRNVCITSNKTHEHARQVVLEYIEVFYNRIQRHATIQNQVLADYAHEFYKNELQIAA
jgi:hypothetical protein